MAIAKREGRSAGEILNEFVANYVRIHEPGNPQWPINRFLEKSKEALPGPEQPTSDYAAMTDEELLKLLQGPQWKLSDFDRMHIKHILKLRSIKAEAYLR